MSIKISSILRKNPPFQSRISPSLVFTSIPPGVSELAKTIKSSARGELEITDLNNLYLAEGHLKGELLGSGFCWFDAGTFNSQMDAATMIRSLETNQDRVIACPEQIAFERGWISKKQLAERANLLQKNSYGAFLKKILEQHETPKYPVTPLNRSTPTSLQDCLILEPKRFNDERGYYSPAFTHSDYSKLGFRGVVQISRSKSAKGVLRGLHFQKDPYAQAKIVEVLQGAVIDVAVDLRKNSPTYRQFETVLLTPENGRQLYIPRGFAHGFLSLEDNTILQYYVDSSYAPEQEDGIIWNDPDININWSDFFSKYNISAPKLSNKDRSYHTLSEYEKGNNP